MLAEVARIRIVDEWLRSPVSGPSRHRTVMVVAESWSEQRVLMRAFMGAADQTRPTIVLHGSELAIGPASADANGSWGIHVEPPVDGRAQELRAQLELAARRMAGSKGNPPRLADEAPSFDERPTGQWAPGTPAGARTRFGRYYEPAEVVAQNPLPALPMPPMPISVPMQPAPTVHAIAPTIAPSIEVRERPRSRTLGAGLTSTPGFGDPAVTIAEPPPAFAAPPLEGAPFDGSRTQPNFAPPPPRPSGFVAASPFAAPFEQNAAGYPAARRTSQGLSVPVVGGPARPTGATPAESLARLVGHTMPIGFRLDDAERIVLDALGGKSHLTASEVAALAGVHDGNAWMLALMKKFAALGLDLIAHGPPSGGEPTYLLRR
jgi:hypothetical protein